VTFNQQFIRISNKNCDDLSAALKDGESTRETPRISEANGKYGLRYFFKCMMQKPP